MLSSQVLAAATLAALTIPGTGDRVRIARALPVFAFQTAESSQSNGKSTRSAGAAIRLNGLVEPVRSQLVTAPRITGGTGTPPQLVIVRLAQAGTLVRKGDVLVEFDRTSQLKNARDREAEYRDILAQIDKKQAELIVARASRQTELTLAQNDVRRAELDLIGVELLATIAAEKNQQALDEARAKLAQLRKTNELRERAAVADLRMLEIQRDRTKNAWDHAADNATRMRIVSPLEGLVVLRSVYKSGAMGEMQEGEEVRPGIPILEVVDPSATRVRAAVNQADIGRLVPGMPVHITLDSYPSRTFTGRLDQVSPIATTSSMSARVRTFAAVFSIDGSDEHLLPDLAAAVEVPPAGAEKALP